MKRVLLVNGPSQDSCDRFFGWPTPLLYAIAPLAAAVRRGDLAVELVPSIFDPVYQVAGLNEDEVRRQFADALEDVDIVCASATYDSLRPTLTLLGDAKRLRPDIITVLGGPHTDETCSAPGLSGPQQLHEAVDYAVAGDGEGALLRLLDCISRDWPPDGFQGVGGEAWVYGRGRSWETSGRPLRLDSLPFIPIEHAEVDRHRHDFDVFVNDNGIVPTVQMIAARGCPYSCFFCSERRELAHPNARSIDSILEEIDLRQRQGFGAVFFDDSTFGSHPRLKDLLRALRGTRMMFGCLNRFNHLLDGRTVGLYRDAGFVYFYCSVEQYDDGTLRSVSKGQSTRTISRAMHVLWDHGAKLGVSLLFGLSGETSASIRATLDFTREWVDRGLVQLVSESVLSLHPGTPAGAGRVQTFNCVPPNLGFPFDQFEEGQWYHEPHVTADYLERILSWSLQRFGPAMIRRRHSWYARNGLVKSVASEGASMSAAGQASAIRPPVDEAA